MWAGKAQGKLYRVERTSDRARLGMKNGLDIGVKQSWVPQARYPSSSMPFCLPCFLLQRKEERGRRSGGGKGPEHCCWRQHTDSLSTAPHLEATLYLLKRKFTGQSNSSLLC